MLDSKRLPDAPQFDYRAAPHHPPHHPHPPPPAHYGPPPTSAPHYQQPPPQQQPPHPPPPPSHNGPPQAPPQAPHHAQYGPPPISLPPIQHAPQYGPGPPQDQSLPPFPHSHPAQGPHDPREGEYHQYSQHNRSGHATPAQAVHRTYSHDSAHQRTPTTPSHPDAPHPHPPQQAHHMEHNQHGYPPNGLPHGAPPQHQQAYQQQDVMTPVYAPPNGQQMYPPPQFGPATAGSYLGQRKKQMRATQACEQCRSRKQKCDEGSPCSFCKENTLVCQYRDTPPAKTDKNMEKLLSYMESSTTGIEQIVHKLSNVDERLQRLESSNAPARADTTRADASADDGADEQHISKKKILADHRTAPHKLLLLWPRVSELLNAADCQMNTGYVMEAEDRGILRLYTRGEGIDEYDGTQPGHQAGPASPARSDDSGTGGGSSSADINIPMAPEGVWGTGFPHSPSGDISRSEPSWGGLKPDNSLDLDVNTITTLHNSYLEHMHIMHPFIDKGRLATLMNKFKQRSSTGQHRLGNAYNNQNQNYADGERPSKRQRSNGPGHLTTTTTPDGTSFRSQATERSPGNAIVFLVLALGKICLHREPLPGIILDNKLSANSRVTHDAPYHTSSTSPLNANIKPSPQSPKSTPNTHPTPNSSDGGGANRHPSRSRRTSWDAAMPTAPRNLDLLPGIAYYAKAAEILGDQCDGNDLVHAQMFLLAGLYKGQLARVNESMAWFTMAGRTVQMLLDRYDLYVGDAWAADGDVEKQVERRRQVVKDKRQNLIVLASWTCLQLESDILAELRLPGSGLLAMEDVLALPNQVVAEQDYTERPEGQHHTVEPVMDYYSCQMFLRRRLNQVHREMYGPDCLNQSLDEVQEMLKGHAAILDRWRDMLKVPLAWEDGDPPATNILGARLRAKYWGARYVVNRPFLDFMIHFMPHIHTKAGLTLENVANDARGVPRDKADIHLFKAIEKMGNSAIVHASRLCIQAAIQSTVALDNVPDRLIVTNIHGTAHAQFGNMLVLAAAFYSGTAKFLVPEETFVRLLERTIQFLRRLRPISPTCALDCQILEKIQRHLFPPDDPAFKNEKQLSDPASATASFGS